MIKDKNKERKLSLRLTEEDYTYLNCLAYMTGMTVSKYVRTLIDASINAVKISESKGQVNLEDIKTLLND